MENIELKLSKYHTIYNFYHVIFKHWKLFSLCFFFAFSSVFLSALITVPVYKQVAKVLVRHLQNQEIVFYRELSTLNFNFRVNPMANYMEVVANRKIGAEVVERYNLAERLREQSLNPKTFPHIYMKYYEMVLTSPITFLKWLLVSLNLIPEEEEPEPDWYNMAIDKFINETLHMLIVVETAVIQIEIYGESMEESADMANFIARKMKEEILQMDTAEADTAVQFAEAQIERLNVELLQARKDIIKFMKENDIINKAAEQQVLSRKLEVLEAQKITEEARKEEYASRVKTLRSQLDKEYIPSNNYQLFLTQLLESEKEATVLHDKVKSMQALVDQLKAENLILENKWIELDRLEKEATVRKAQIDMLRSTVEKLIIQRINSMNEHNLIILEPAEAWKQKSASWPIMPLYITLGIICGLTLAFLVPFVIEFWRETYTIPYEVEKQLRIPVIATIPEASPRKLFKGL